MRYIDPDGNLLILAVNKETQTLTVTYRDGSVSMSYTIGPDKITTGVVSQDRTQVTDYSRTQNTGDFKTNPTQFPDGLWNLTEIGETSDPERFGEFWIKTDATQDLDAILSPELREALGLKEGDVIKAEDGGYYIHFTIYSNTNGCLGLKVKEEMQKLLDLFRMNRSSNDNRALLLVTGDPTSGIQ
jgi:hypothetical protein